MGTSSGNCKKVSVSKEFCASRFIEYKQKLAIATDEKFVRAA